MTMPYRLLFCCSFLAICLRTLAAEETTSTFRFSEAQNKASYIKTFTAWRDEAKTAPGTSDQVLVIGASNIGGWKNLDKDLAPLKVLQRGFGGSHAGDAARFADFFATYPCERVVIQYGHSMEPPKATADGILGEYRTLLDALLANKSRRVYLLTTRSDTDINRAIGMGLRKIATENPRVIQVDLRKDLCDESGAYKKEMARDGVHFSPVARNIIATALKSLLLESGAQSKKSSDGKQTLEARSP